jgi:hypothetical protein
MMESLGNDEPATMETFMGIERELRLQRMVEGHYQRRSFAECDTVMGRPEMISVIQPHIAA